MERKEPGHGSWESLHEREAAQSRSSTSGAVKTLRYERNLALEKVFISSVGGHNDRIFLPGPCSCDICTRPSTETR